VKYLGVRATQATTGLQSTAVYQKEKIQGVRNETNDCVFGGGVDISRKKNGNVRMS